MYSTEDLESLRKKLMVFDTEIRVIYDREQTIINSLKTIKDLENYKLPVFPKKLEL